MGAVHEIELEMANPDDPYKLNGMNAIKEGAEKLGHGHWFQADNFEDFWQELTGRPLNEMPMEGHLMMWLEQNPGKTLNEISKAIDPLHKDVEDAFWNVAIDELK